MKHSAFRGGDKCGKNGVKFGLLDDPRAGDARAVRAKREIGLAPKEKMYDLSASLGMGSLHAAKTWEVGEARTKSKRTNAHERLFPCSYYSFSRANPDAITAGNFVFQVRTRQGTVKQAWRGHEVLETDCEQATVGAGAVKRRCRARPTRRWGRREERNGRELGGHLRWFTSVPPRANSGNIAWDLGSAFGVRAYPALCCFTRARLSSWRQARAGRRHRFCT